MELPTELTDVQRQLADNLLNAVLEFSRLGDAKPPPGRGSQTVASWLRHLGSRDGVGMVLWVWR